MRITNTILTLGLILIGFGSYSQELDEEKGDVLILSKMSRVDLPKIPDTLEKAVLINGTLYQALIINEDTIPLVNLPQADVLAKRKFKSTRQMKRYRRLERHVRKVYPYAHLAGERLAEYEKELANIHSKRDRKKRMKQAEKEIRAEFEGDLKKLSFTQGRVLLKLIDRETGDVSYELVKELRGGFTAWFFQGIALIFKFDLKSNYDPSQGEDRDIEYIVQQIERENAIKCSALTVDQ
jgi:hypothetical protein